MEKNFSLADLIASAAEEEADPRPPLLGVGLKAPCFSILTGLNISGSILAGMNLSGLRLFLNTWPADLLPVQESAEERARQIGNYFRADMERQFQARMRREQQAQGIVKTVFHRDDPASRN